MSKNEAAEGNQSSKVPTDVMQDMSEEDFQYLLQEFWDFSLYHGMRWS